MKAGRFRNFIIAGHKFKNLPVYERGGKGLQFFLKEYQDSLPEGEGSVGFGIFHDIVKLMTMCVESKYGLSIYYIKFRHGKNVFDAMLDRIGEIYLNGTSSINTICFIKTLKIEWHNHYEFSTW